MNLRIKEGGGGGCSQDFGITPSVLDCSQRFGVKSGNLSDLFKPKVENLGSTPKPGEQFQNP